MSAFDFQSLLDHAGHKIKVNTYIDKENDNEVVNVAVECMTCYEVLLDFDNPKYAEED
jgi:hypothetical protein